MRDSKGRVMYGVCVKRGEGGISLMLISKSGYLYLCLHARRKRKTRRPLRSRRLREVALTDSVSQRRSVRGRGSERGVRLSAAVNARVICLLRNLATFTYVCMHIEKGKRGGHSDPGDCERSL